MPPPTSHQIVQAQAQQRWILCDFLDRIIKILEAQIRQLEEILRALQSIRNFLCRYLPRFICRLMDRIIAALKRIIRLRKMLLEVLKRLRRWLCGQQHGINIPGI